MSERGGDANNMPYIIVDPNNPMVLRKELERLTLTILGGGSDNPDLRTDPAIAETLNTECLELDRPIRSVTVRDIGWRKQHE